MTIFEIEYSDGSKIEYIVKYAGTLTDDECFEDATHYAVSHRPKDTWIQRVECIAC